MITTTRTTNLPNSLNLLVHFYFRSFLHPMRTMHCYCCYCKWLWCLGILAIEILESIGFEWDRATNGPRKANQKTESINWMLLELPREFEKQRVFITFNEVPLNDIATEPNTISPILLLVSHDAWSYTYPYPLQMSMYDRVVCELLLSGLGDFSLRRDAAACVVSNDDVVVWLFVAKQTFCTALESNNRRRPVQSHSRNSTTLTCSLENGNIQLKWKRNKNIKQVRLGSGFSSFNSWVNLNFGQGMSFFRMISQRSAEVILNHRKHYEYVTNIKMTSNDTRHQCVMRNWYRKIRSTHCRNQRTHVFAANNNDRIVCIYGNSGHSKIEIVADCVGRFMTSS